MTSIADSDGYIISGEKEIIIARKLFGREFVPYDRRSR